MSVNIFLIIIYCTIISLDGTNAKKRSRDRYKTMAPIKLRCQDKNRQRNLVWQSSIEPKHGWSLTGYIVKKCISTNCLEYETVRCYRDSATTYPANRILNDTHCLLSSVDVIPWMTYKYRVSAIYRSTKNVTKKLMISSRVNCLPIDRGYEQMAPTKLSCEDRNLQRSLIWQSPIKVKPEWKFMGYTAEKCLPTGCSYKTVLCYHDNARTHLANGALNDSYCLMSPSNVIPWTIYLYKVSALYRNVQNYSKEFTMLDTVTCDPVERTTTLDAPYFDWIQTTTSAISFLMKIPDDLEDAIKASHNYDLLITYSFCLFESGKSCQTKDLRIDTCNPLSTYSKLKEGTKYTISAWYTSRASGKQIRSANATVEVQTEIDYFPPKAQILLVIAISAILILTIAALVLWRTTRSIRHKWEALVNKEIPRYFVEALKDLSKANGRFIMFVDWKKHMYDRNFQENELDVARMVVPAVKPNSWEHLFETDKAGHSADKSLATPSVEVTKHCLPQHFPQMNFSPEVLRRESENTASAEMSWTSNDTLVEYLTKLNSNGDGMT